MEVRAVRLTQRLRVQVKDAKMLSRVFISLASFALMQIFSPFGWRQRSFVVVAAATIWNLDPSTSAESCAVEKDASPSYQPSAQEHICIPSSRATRDRANTQLCCVAILKHTWLSESSPPPGATRPIGAVSDDSWTAYNSKGSLGWRRRYPIWAKTPKLDAT